MSFLFGSDFDEDSKMEEDSGHAKHNLLLYLYIKNKFSYRNVSI